MTTGCATTTPPPGPTVVTKLVYVYLPDRFFEPCTKTAWVGKAFREVAGLAKSRGTDVDDCNAQLAAARGYQDDLRRVEGANRVEK